MCMLVDMDPKMCVFMGGGEMQKSIILEKIACEDLYLRIGVPKNMHVFVQTFSGEKCKVM